MSARTRLFTTVLACFLVGVSEAQEPDFDWYPVVKPAYFYSGTAGFGAGMGLNGSNLFMPGDAVRLRSRVQQYRQSAELGWSTTSPVTGRSFVLVSGSIYRNLRESFYGIGPGSDGRRERLINRFMTGVEVRLARRPHRSLWIQPRLGFRVDQLVDLGSLEDGPDGPAMMAQRSLEGLWFGTLEPGVDLGFDTGATVIQVHGTARYGQFRQVRAGLILDHRWRRPGRRRLAARLMVDRTLNRSEKLPYFFLAGLDDNLAAAWDRNRFYGNDRIVVGLAYIHPLVELAGFAYEAVLFTGASQVYDDLTKDFRAAVVWDPNRRDLRTGRVPLEPTFGVGSQLIKTDSRAVVFSAMLGLSSEGLEAASFRFAQRLSDWFPAARQ